VADARRSRATLDQGIVQHRTRLELKPDALYARCAKLGIAASALPKIAALPTTAKGVEAIIAAGRELAASFTTFARMLKEEAARRTNTEKALLKQALKAADVIAPHAESLDALVSEMATADRTAVRAADDARKRAEDVATRLKHRTEMEADIAAKGKRSQVFSDLALELRADRIVAFLQAEALQAMATSASIHLAQLSDDRYRLVCRDDDEFFVIDRLMGDEERSVRTLSGGETFLASLALALGLAAQVRALSMSARAHLDSLFLDEGFGSLDSEALETASEAIQRLAGDGRLVGVISHIPALSDQFTRIEVVKTPKGSSTLRFVSWPERPAPETLADRTPAMATQRSDS
jgi:exonuclease SbcC